MAIIWKLLINFISLREITIMNMNIDLKNWKKAWIVILVLLLLTPLASKCGGDSNDDYYEVPNIGDMATVTAGTFGAMGKNNYNEMIKSIRASDEVGIVQMIASHQILSIDSGIVVKVIDINEDKDLAEVRLPNGVAVYMLPRMLKSNQDQNNK